MNDIPKHALAGGCICFVLVPSAEIIGDDRINTDDEADGDGINQVLYGLYKGQSGHGVFADLGYKIAVYNIIQRIHGHGDDHGQRHGQQQPEDRFFLHKCLIHNMMISFTCACGSACVLRQYAEKKPHNYQMIIVWRKIELL